MNDQKNIPAPASVPSNPPPPPAPAPAPDAKAQDAAQKRLVEKMHGPQGTAALAAAANHRASTSTLLTTDAHVGKRSGEEHKPQEMEDLKVGAATRTTDETAKAKTVDIAAGAPANQGKPTDKAVLATENQGLAPAPLGSTGHGSDAVGVTDAIADKTGKPPGEVAPPVPAAQPSKGAAEPATAGMADAETKGKNPESAKPAETPAPAK